jgi:hypothetical protein
MSTTGTDRILLYLSFQSILRYSTPRQQSPSPLSSFPLPSSPYNHTELHLSAISLQLHNLQDTRYMTPYVLQVEAENNERAYYDNIEVERKK